MKIKRRTVIELSIGFAIAIWVGIEAMNEYGAKSEIELHKGVAVGEIIDYRIVGAHSHYVSYEYYVNNVRYNKSVSASKVFRGCHKTKDCLGRKFRVYFSLKEPEKSIIKLDEEVFK